MSYPVPANESQRLAILNALEILDTPLEERYERITRLLAKALGVEGAAISFVDRDRVWFKSITGADLTETTRDVSFCSHAICEDGLFVVEDASADPRFVDNPLVTRPGGQRFYACSTRAKGLSAPTSFSSCATWPRRSSANCGPRCSADRHRRAGAVYLGRPDRPTNATGSAEQTHAHAM
jgi:hypothetical protein